LHRKQNIESELKCQTWFAQCQANSAIRQRKG
jgi:hypothetical protein